MGVSFITRFPGSVVDNGYEKRGGELPYNCQNYGFRLKIVICRGVGGRGGRGGARGGGRHFSS